MSGDLEGGGGIGFVVGVGEVAADDLEEVGAEIVVDDEFGEVVGFVGEDGEIEV